MATRSSVSVSESLPETTVDTAGGGCAERKCCFTSVLSVKVAGQTLHTHSSLVGGTRWRCTWTSYNVCFQRHDEQGTPQSSSLRVCPLPLHYYFSRFEDLRKKPPQPR